MNNLSPYEITPELRQSRWAILNQSQSPTFQRVFERLASDLGSCVLLTGSPFVPHGKSLIVRRGPQYRRRTGMQRIASWVTFAWAAIRTMVQLPGGTFILVVTNPPFLPHVTWLMSFIFGFSFAVLVWDIYPDHLVASRIVKPSGVVARMWRCLNRATFRRAALVVTIGQRMADTLATQVGSGDRTKIRVIPNWADSRLHAVPKERNEFARATDQIGKITVLYSGNVSLAEGLKHLIHAADLLRSDSRVSFLFVGEGRGKRVLEEDAKRRCLENVLFFERQAWQDLPLVLATGDIAVVAQERGKEHLSLPSKTYSSLAVGSAILAITDPKSDLAQIVKEHDVGVTCGNSADEIVAAIRGYLDDSPRLRDAQTRAVNVAGRIYSEDAAYAAWRVTLSEAGWGF